MAHEAKDHGLETARGRLAATLSGANRQYSKWSGSRLDTVVIPWTSSQTTRQHLGCGRGHGCPALRRGTCAHHVARAEEQERRINPRFNSRCWVAERPNHWNSLFRKLRTRYEVHTDNCLGFVQFTIAMICSRRAVAWLKQVSGRTLAQLGLASMRKREPPVLGALRWGVRSLDAEAPDPRLGRVSGSADTLSGAPGGFRAGPIVHRSRSLLREAGCCGGRGTSAFRAGLFYIDFGSLCRPSGTNTLI